MQLVGLDQNTLEWLEARKRFIGGSDVPSIMGVSPWRTVFQLWEEKLSICSPDMASKAYIFERGHRFEAIARQAYELRIGFDIPAQVVQHQSIPWARVSLDCFSLNHRFVGEIKYMGMADWTLLKEKGIVPDHYMPQVQYQLMITGFDELHFIGINEAKQLAVTKVYPDLDAMKKIVRWCSHFWNLVKTNTPPKMTQQDYRTVMRKGAQKAINRIYSIDAKIKDLFEERDRLQDEVLKVCKSTRMLHQRKVMIRLDHFDSVDLWPICELRGQDLSWMDRSLKDNLKLIIVKNSDPKIKGAKHGSKKTKGTTKRKSTTAKQ